MKARTRLPLIAAVLIGIALSPLNSPAPIFMHYDGVDGECTAPGHEREIDLLSFSQSHSRSNLATSPKLNEVVVTKSVDKSSPKLAEHCAKGQLTPNVVIFVRKAGGTTNDYYKITLNDVLVSSYQIGGGGGSSGDPQPTESISFNYSKIEWHYQRQDQAGQPIDPPVIGSWPPPGVP